MGQVGDKDGEWGTCYMRKEKKKEGEITEMKRYECLVVQLICRELNGGKINSGEHFVR